MEDRMGVIVVALTMSTDSNGQGVAKGEGAADEDEAIVPTS